MRPGDTVYSRCNPPAKKRKESFNTTEEEHPVKLSSNTNGDDIADLLLSPYYSPTTDAKNPSLRAYLLNTYGANSILPPFSSELSFAHSVSGAIKEKGEESVMRALLDIPLETLLRQLVEKYTSDLEHRDNSLGIAEDTNYKEVRLEEVQLEVQALAKHTRDVMAHNQARIQSLQTGADNPYIALRPHAFALKRYVRLDAEADVLLSSVLSTRNSTSRKGDSHLQLSQAPSIRK